MRAVNYLGAGAYSELNTDQSFPGTAFVKTVPATPQIAPYRNPEVALLATDSISVVMPEVEDESDEAGGAIVTSYQLEWKQPGETVFQDLIGSSGDNLNRAITVSTNPGESYVFRYRISNVFGWSTAYSPEVTIISAMPPDTPATVTTSIEGSYVKIVWVAPDNNYAAISSYQITILDLNRDPQVELDTCDGSDASVRESTECLIPLTTLIA